MDSHNPQRESRQLDKVRTIMLDGQWRTPDEIVSACGGTSASITARLRDLRRPEHGAHQVDRRLRGHCKNLWEYRVSVIASAAPPGGVPLAPTSATVLVSGVEDDDVFLELMESVFG